MIPFLEVLFRSFDRGRLLRCRGRWDPGCNLHSGPARGKPDKNWRFTWRSWRPCEICGEFEECDSAPLLAILAVLEARPTSHPTNRQLANGRGSRAAPDIQGAVGQGRANRWWVFASQICSTATIAQIAGICSRGKPHRRDGLLDPPYIFRNSRRIAARRCWPTWPCWPPGKLDRRRIRRAGNWKADAEARPPQIFRVVWVKVARIDGGSSQAGFARSLRLLRLQGFARDGRPTGESACSTHPTSCEIRAELQRAGLAMLAGPWQTRLTSLPPIGQLASGRGSTAAPDIQGGVGQGRANRWWVFTSRIRSATEDPPVKRLARPTLHLATSERRAGELCQPCRAASVADWRQTSCRSED